MTQTQEIYLDNAATTKPCAESVEALARAYAEEYGNASSAHARGKAAKRLLEESRATLADALGVEPKEIYFTSGATEANNLAIRGAAEARGREAGAIVTSELEHPSVTRSVRGMRRMGWETKHIPAPGGDFNMTALEQALAQPTQLVTVMQVQNELGYVFPIADIAALVREQGFMGTAENLGSSYNAGNAPTPASQANPARPLIHCDATQAFGKLDVTPVQWGVDLLSVTAHKLRGPKGIGALYVKQGTKLFTTAFGGGQERGLRSGTEAVFLAAGFAAAVQHAMAHKSENYTHVQQLKDHLVTQLNNAFPNLVMHSRADGSPYIVSFAIPGLAGANAVQRLSEQGIYVSRSSACTFNRHNVKGEWREKHPLSMQAAGISEELTESTLRLSFSPTNTLQDIDAFIGALKQIV